MSFGIDAPKIWPVMPDWTNGVTETLSWSTEVLKATGTGVSQHRGLRVGPARSLAIESLAYGQSRRIADALLASWAGEWLLPVWPDVQWLSSRLTSGAAGIECATVGLDFVAGGQAVLFDEVNTWELVTIDAVGSEGLTFVAPTIAAHSVGSRIYPVRTARARDAAQETLHSEDIGLRSITFDMAEPCDWPELASPTQYLGHLVLDRRPDESDSPTYSYSRLSQSVDYGTSKPLIYDLPGFAFRSQQSNWTLIGREPHSWFRSLIYTLQGQRVPIWVPSFAADLQPVSAINGATMQVEWAGYTQFGLGRGNRRDLRIELFDGSVFYRRITGAAEATNTETLTLDSALDGSPIDPSIVRQVSFLALSTQASDDVEIDHATDADGVATVTTGWMGVVPDV